MKSITIDVLYGELQSDFVVGVPFFGCNFAMDSYSTITKGTFLTNFTIEYLKTLEYSSSYTLTQQISMGTAANIYKTTHKNSLGGYGFNPLNIYQIERLFNSKICHKLLLTFNRNVATENLNKVYVSFFKNILGINEMNTLHLLQTNDKINESTTLNTITFELNHEFEIGLNSGVLLQFPVLAQSTFNDRLASLTFIFE